MRTGNLVAVRLFSFGFLHRPAPEDVTIVLDLRVLLRDPYVSPGLLEPNGRDPQVRQHVLATPGAARLVWNTAVVVHDLLADAGDPGGWRVDVAVGCAGGRHRSVVVVEELAKLLVRGGTVCEIEHLDVDRQVLRPAR